MQSNRRGNRPPRDQEDLTDPGLGVCIKRVIERSIMPKRKAAQNKWGAPLRSPGKGEGTRGKKQVNSILPQDFQISLTMIQGVHRSASLSLGFFAFPALHAQLLFWVEATYWRYDYCEGRARLGLIRNRGDSPLFLVQGKISATSSQ